MNKIRLGGFLGLALAVGLAAAETPARLRLVFAERFRFEAWDNAVNLNAAAADGFAYTRNKTTFGLEWRPSPAWELVGKLTNEFRVYLSPKDRPFDAHEIFFDNLYVRWKGGPRAPFTLTIGRQDIFLGEGFVVADGNPLDGSRSYYFNAVRLDWDIAGAGRLTAFAHATPERDELLPVIRDRRQALVDQPERAWAVYYAGQAFGADLDVYALAKSVDETENGPPSAIRTYGARLRAAIGGPLSLTAEGALQSGTFGGEGRAAAGGIFHLDLSPRRIPYLKTLTLGGIALSGDDPATPRREAWDPVFSRWPKWSEGYIYTFIRESRAAYWSNLTSLYASVLFDFGSPANAVLTFHRLGAGEPPPAGAAFPGGSGLRRGNLFVGRLNFVAGPGLSGHLVWESFRPGDFYAPDASGFNWIRFELLFRF